MAFRTVLERTFTHRVAVQVPVDGGHKEESLKATYRVLDTDKIEGFDLETPEGTSDFIRAALVKLDELIKDDGSPDEYNDELRDQLIKLPYLRIALIRGYFEAVGKGRRKN